MSGADLRVAQSLQCTHKCDVACFFYDASVVSAFEYAASIHVCAALGGPAITCRSGTSPADRSACLLPPRRISAPCRRCVACVLRMQCDPSGRAGAARAVLRSAASACAHRCLGHAREHRARPAGRGRALRGE